MTYQWERSDGGIDPPLGITFAGAGSQTVRMLWHPSTSGFGWARLRILRPNVMTSNHANFTLTCRREVTLSVVGNETGSISTTDLVSNAIVGAGDGALNASISGYVSFDITAFAGRTVQSITLTMNPAIESGDRSFLGDLWIGTLDYDTGPLQAAARLIPAVHLATFPNRVTAISYGGENMRTALQSRIDARNPRFQLKMYWSRPSSDGDFVEDGLGYLDIYQAVSL
ncbi:hypothetical protein HKBW3S42_00551 [Candidatus Hakubella thermalkaliphila]|uniref:Uncharacterized protein n=1 Tax=Candidatus Hakubella thermalkaliphila TaxID=2754717 RepID=A0A6V8QLQ3_9ACTN|nr:hypothetical protein HKBW3S42_00551 [Candidatus Hakubella thermalkaliphila]GFP43691.1 hypothetical protein HKBW3C_02820 [Candidatus Hakubella thermalkaliphila]